MVSPRASRKSASTARRGASGRPTMAATSESARAPEQRTMPTPLRPAAVAIAAMVSAVIGPHRNALRGGRWIAGLPRPQGAIDSVLACAGGFAFHHARDLPLLRDREYVVDQPVEHQAGGEKEEEDAEHDRHDLHHLGLDRVRRLGIE